MLTERIYLEGGPRDLAYESRSQHVSELPTKIKLQHGNGYEHFERTDDRTNEMAVVYRWTTSTRIAE
ncbi:DUF5988 family protein [Micromonospora sp. DT233]|uniref:DUF5988 family protein n=1 Tax=Micromonospora sp. DT233 TaxID=3393432 RepID=UPI003CEA12FE